MAKTIYWRQAHSKIPCAPCPFLGVTVNSFDEFVVKVLQDRLFHYTDKTNDKGWYPAVDFATCDRRFRLFFTGTRLRFNDAPINKRTGKPYKWALTDIVHNKHVRYFDAKTEGNEIFKLFPDAEVEKAKVNAISKFIKENNGIVITVE